MNDQTNRNYGSGTINAVGQVTGGTGIDASSRTVSVTNTPAAQEVALRELLAALSRLEEGIRAARDLPVEVRQDADQDIGSAIVALGRQPPDIERAAHKVDGIRRKLEVLNPQKYLPVATLVKTVLEIFEKLG